MRKFILSLEEPNFEIEASNLKVGLKKLAEYAAEIGLGIEFDRAKLFLGLATPSENYLFSEKTTDRAQKIFDELLETENNNFYQAMIHGGNYQNEEGEWQTYSDNEMYL
jgi:hypothetical protein